MSTESNINAFIDDVEKLYQFVDEVDDGFAKEFQKIKQLSAGLKQSITHRTTVGEQVENKKKNRYKDILPYDFARVELPSNGEPFSNYINASFIKGADDTKSYIASQGPLPHTVNDFWRMLWAYKVKVIIMVCREVEMGKRKCERYWSGPDEKEGKNFGDIFVKVEQSGNLNEAEHGFVKRVIIAQKGNEIRKLHHLHYITWPDHCLPRTRQDILSMVEEARKIQDYSEDVGSPLCVHCSAGCGRTGAVLVIDYFRNLLIHNKLNGKLRVFDVVTAMRKQRPAIVQTKDQYEFVHLAVTELFTNYLKEHQGKNPSSKLSQAVSNTSYENVTLPEKPQKRPTTPSQDGQKPNAYENVSVQPGEKNAAAQTKPKPTATAVSSRTNQIAPPPKPSRGPTSSGQMRPVSSYEPLDCHKLHSQHQTLVPFNNKGLKAVPASRKPPDTKTTKPTSHSNFNNAQNKPSPTKIGLNQNSPSAPKPKPKPRVAGASYLDASAVPQKPKLSSKPGTGTNQRKPDSVQARKERLWSQGLESPSSLHKKSDVSASVSDLRSINREFSPPNFRRKVVRTISVENNLCKALAKHDNTSNKKTQIKVGCQKSAKPSNINAAQKPSAPPASLKPNVLPKKSKSSTSSTKDTKINGQANVSLTNVKTSRNSKSSASTADSYLNPKPQDALPGYVNATSTLMSTNSNYTHISTQKTKLLLEDPYDILNLSSNVSAPKPEKKDQLYAFADGRSQSDSVAYSTSKNISSKFLSNLGPVPFRAPLSSTTSSVFDMSPTSKETSDPNFGISHPTEVALKDHKKPASPVNNQGLKPPPPLKPKRTFRKAHNPYLQANNKGENLESPDSDTPPNGQYAMANDSNFIEDAYAETNKCADIYSVAEPTYYSVPADTAQITLTDFSSDTGGMREADYVEVPEQKRDYIGSRPRSSSTHQINPVSSNSVQPPRLPNRPTESPPLLPQRTPESYILRSPGSSPTQTANKYEDINAELKPNHAETGRRTSGASSLAAVRSKAKGVFEKTTTAFNVNVLHHLTNSSKDETPSLMTSRPGYTQEPMIYQNQDISFGNRCKKKPKGPRPQPEHWAKTK